MTNIKRAKIITVILADEIKRSQIEKFRGAVIGTVGRENTLYNNHNDDPGKPKHEFAYPRIQYKVFHRKPIILFLGEGCDECDKFLATEKAFMNIPNKSISTRVERLSVDFIDFSLGKDYYYQLIDWIPFVEQKDSNKDPMSKKSQWAKLKNDAERFQFLEPILHGHIKALAEATKCPLPENWERSIENMQPIIKRHEMAGISNEFEIGFKKQNLLHLTLTIRTNFYIPDFIGLGPKSAHGFGMLVRL